MSSIKTKKNEFFFKNFIYKYDLKRYYISIKIERKIIWQEDEGN